MHRYTLCALVLAACGDDKAGGTSAVGDSIEAQMAANVCDIVTHCRPDEGTGWLAIWARASPALCPAFIRREWSGTRGIDAGVARGAYIVDQAKLTSCLAAVRASCSLDVGFDSADCRGAITGTVAVGGDCHGDRDCAGDAFCKNTGSGCGKCAARVALGQPCDDNSDACSYAAGPAACASYLVGRRDPTYESKCVPIETRTGLAEGEICGTSETADKVSVGVCAEGLGCVYHEADDTVRCQPLKPAGAPCESGNECAQPNYCKGTCLNLSVPVTGTAGAACSDYADEGLPVCNAMADLACVDGTCTNFADGTAGSYCAEANVCDPGLYCGGDDDVCTAQVGEGSPCSSNSACTTGLCWGAVCTADTCITP